VKHGGKLVGGDIADDIMIWLTILWVKNVYLIFILVALD